MECMYGVGEAIIKVIRETCSVTLFIVCLMSEAYQPFYMEHSNPAQSAEKKLCINGKYQTLTIYSYQASCLENWRQ